MKKTTLSVAMCTYNGENYLQEQLDSIVIQSCLPDELVVCDDDSTDKTINVLRSFAEKASLPVRIFANETNLGSTKNFEKAIKLCEGDIIALADQDDVWKSNKLKKLLKVLEENPEAGYVFSNAELVNEHLAPLGYSLWQSIGFQDAFFKRYAKCEQVSVLLKRSVVTGTTLAFRASLKSLVLPISALWMHDGWIALLASSVGSYGVSLPESLIDYRQHAVQQIGGGRKSLFKKYKSYRASKKEEYTKAVQAFQDMKNRLLQVKPAPGKETFNPLEQKIIHSYRRATIYSSHGFPKVKMILSEALTGRYHRFSNSWQSIAKDFL